MQFLGIFVGIFIGISILILVHAIGKDEVDKTNDIATFIRGWEQGYYLVMSGK